MSAAYPSSGNISPATPVAPMPGVGQMADVAIRSEGKIILSLGRTVEMLSIPSHLEGTYKDLIRHVFPDQEWDGINAIEKCAEICGRRWRASYSSNLVGMELVMRLLPESIVDPEDLLVPKSVVDKFMELNSGIVIICGPTGMGKSTTIASLCAKRAKLKSERFVTLEDPIEFVYPEIGSSSFTQREVGINCTSYSKGLTEALRQAPNVIIVQETRDRASAETALTASLSGHLVVTTLHSGFSHLAVQRYASLLGGEEAGSAINALASSVQMIVAQRLLRNEKLQQAMAVHEVMINTPAIEQHIRNRNYNGIRQSVEIGSKLGMQTYSESLEMRVAEKRLPKQLRDSFEF